MTKSAKLTLEGALATTALAALIGILGLIVIAIVSGISQGPFQNLYPPEEYARLLMKDPAWLRIALGVDNLFLLMYGAFFTLLATYLLREDRSHQFTVVTAAVALLLTGLLDLTENLHIAGMLNLAEQAAAIPLPEIHFQTIESAFKFYVSYFGLFLFGVVYPRRTAIERVTSWILFMFAPIGLLAHIVPPATAPLLVLARSLLFVATFALAAIAFHARRRRAQQG